MKPSSLFLLLWAALAPLIPLKASESILLSGEDANRFWTPTNSRMEPGSVDGKPVIRWHLEPGMSAILDLKKDHPLFSRLRYFDRLEFDFRIVSGLADHLDFRAMDHRSGPRQFKIHQWQASILTTPTKTWHTRLYDLDRPNWFPWDNKDGNTPHFHFTALGVEPNTVIEISNLRLIANPLAIKPFFEYPITWPIKAQENDGSITYKMEIPVLNTSGRPSKLNARLASTHEHFDVSFEPANAEVVNGATATFVVTAKLSKAAMDATQPLYSETIRLAVYHEGADTVYSTFELPVTRPLDPGYRKQFVLSEDELSFVRERLKADDADVKKAIEFDRVVKEADRFLEIRLLNIPTGHLAGRINFWPVVPGTKVRYEIGDLMPEVINPVTGEREFGTDVANRVWKEYLGQMGKITETLGYAYLFTQDEKYARKAVELMELWAKQYHQLSWTHTWEPAWSNGPALLASSRIAKASSYGTNWLMRYTMRMIGMIGDSPSLTPEARERIYQGFVLPYATEIAKFPGGISNMTDITNHNLLVLGLVFEDANLVRWATLSDPGLFMRLKDLDEDGFSSEGRSLNYHIAAMQEFLPSIAYLKNSGLKFDFPMDRLLEAMRMPYQRATLWGHIPNSGDCGRGASATRFAIADDLVPLFPKEKWLMDIGNGSRMSSKIHRLMSGHTVDPNAVQARLESSPRLYKTAGLAILRSGDKPENQIMATLDYGRNPMHGHFDRNQITLSAFGKVFTHGPGTMYNAGRGGIILSSDAELESFCGNHSISQNVILVDSFSQQTAIGELLTWSDQSDHQFATSRVPSIAQGVDHTRTLILKDGLVIVVDVVASDDSHVYDFAYHNLGALSPGSGWSATPESSPLATRANYQNIRHLHKLSGKGPIHLHWDLTEQVGPKHNGEKDSVHLALWQLPHEKGSVYTGVTGMHNPNTTKITDEAPSLFHRVEGSTVRFVTLLEPYRTKAEVTSIEGDDEKLIIHRNGKKEVIRYSDYLPKQ